MKKEENFNKIEKKILKVLYNQKISLTNYEIAKEAGISFQTAKKYIDVLLKKKIIYEVKEDKKKKA